LQPSSSDPPKLQRPKREVALVNTEWGFICTGGTVPNYYVRRIRVLCRRTLSYRVPSLPLNTVA